MSRPLRTGILIIGSLLWDSRNGREQWRRSRLRMDDRRPVPAPIRYGRFSDQRKTYTMVFSRLCYRQRGLGTAQLVPCVSSVSSAAELITEAEYLAQAEGLSEWTWGGIGVAVNPQASVAKDILGGWAGYFAKRSKGCQVFKAHARTETAVLSARGILRLDWPAVSSGGALEIDLLLATATAPHIEKKLRDKWLYARPVEIAEAYAKLSTPEYFVENVRSDIRTNQDAAIWKATLRHRPDWAKEFADIADRVSS